MMSFTTPDLCDEHPEVTVLEPLFSNFGGISNFYGKAVTIKCFEDNSMVKKLAAEPGQGRVMVVDGGASERCALLGDMVAEQAASNGWSGLVIYGCIRDVDAIGEIQLGVQALNTHPRKTDKRGLGDIDVPVTFAGATIHPGCYVYADNNGVLISEKPLLGED